MTYVSKHLVETILIEQSSKKILLLKRAQPPLVWSTVTGGVKKGEKMWEAALRELNEETGVTPDRLFSGQFSNQFYEARQDQIYHIFSFVAFVEHRPDIVLDEEHSFCEWIDIKTACARIPFAAQREGLKHVEREYINQTPNSIFEIQI